MSAEIKVEKKGECGTQNRVTIKPDETRILWLAVLHGLTIIIVALRKYLKLEARHCMKCGTDL